MKNIENPMYTADPPEPAPEYDTDLYAWTEDQAARLRAHDPAIDWENVAEEIESLGKSDKRQLRNHLAAILEHLLKLTLLTDTIHDRNERGWNLTIREQRHQIFRLLKDSPSLKRHLSAMLPEAYEDAKLRIEYEVETPEECPFSLEEVLGQAE